MLSGDSEYIFYTRSGTAFGKNGEAKVVEVHPIRHLGRVRAVTFGFGDGRHLRNTQLLGQLWAHGTIYMAIETSSFRGENGGKKSVLLWLLRLTRSFTGISLALIQLALMLAQISSFQLMMRICSV
jgi:hypothetical protein